MNAGVFVAVLIGAYAVLRVLHHRISLVAAKRRNRSEDAIANDMKRQRGEMEQLLGELIAEAEIYGRSVYHDAIDAELKNTRGRIGPIARATLMARTQTYDAARLQTLMEGSGRWPHRQADFPFDQVEVTIPTHFIHADAAGAVQTELGERTTLMGKAVSQIKRAAATHEEPEWPKPLQAAAERYLDAYAALRAYERELERVVPSAEKRKRIRVQTLPDRSVPPQ
jgi:hypothetical protein